MTDSNKCVYHSSLLTSIESSSKYSKYSKSSKSCNYSKSNNPCDNPCDNTCDNFDYRDAVVKVQAEFILLGQTGTAGGSEITSATGTTPLAPNNRADAIIEYNGFFIKNHYIVCTSQNVLIPPSLTSVANRYPIFDPDNITLGQIKDQLTQASRIFVTVNNVNGCGVSYIYQARLRIVDGAGNIALLEIEYDDAWNSEGRIENNCPYSKKCDPCNIANPIINKCHPYFKVTSNCKVQPGDEIYVIGDYVAHATNNSIVDSANSITKGTLVNNSFMDNKGFDLAENVLITLPANVFSVGLPIVTKDFKVIGMITRKVDYPGQNYYVAGVSSEFMRNVIRKYIKYVECPEAEHPHLELIEDPVGDFFRYVKGYAGIAYDVFNGSFYDQTVDYTSGLPPLGQPRVRLDANGNFLSSPFDKSIQGIRVLGIAGLNPTDAVGVQDGYHYVPGGAGVAPLPASLPNSPFLFKLRPGDLINIVNCQIPGNEECQIVPALKTWEMLPGDSLCLYYRRGGNALNTADNSATENYNNFYSITGILGEFPKALDYPWYNIKDIPLLSRIPYPGFIFNTQLEDPQVIQLNTVGAGVFHPAF